MENSGLQLIGLDQLFEIAPCDTAAGKSHNQRRYHMETVSVADILEQEIEPTIEEWLRRMNLVPELTKIRVSIADRTGHLSKLYAT
jgi:hypothetical protein